MQTNIETKKTPGYSPTRTYLILVLSIILTSFVTFFLYQNTQWFFKWSLQQKILSIANTASISFHPKDLDHITGMQSVGHGYYENTVLQLQSLRLKNQNIKYAYIQRKTDDPATLIFVADADALHPDHPIDLNQNGIIDDDEQLSKPGDPYDVSEYPDFIKIAFTDPYVDDKLSVDQWGTHLSATSPIFDTDGKARYLIGIDVDVSDYIKLTNFLLVPFVLFIVFLLLVLTGLTISTMKIWKSRLEILSQLDRQKDELLGLVSHQLAAPVSAIRWYVEMLLDGDLGELDKAQKDQLQTVYHTATGLTDLVGMILDVSRVQLGRVKIDKQKMDLNELFAEILAVVEPKALERKIEFIKDVPKDFPPAMLDKRYTHMTLENLLTNAIKYTPEHGKVTVKVTVHDDQMDFMVQDNGCGIPVADQKKIFGKMFRASNVRNSSTDGNGFGLFVAKGAVESQGGKIWFESTEGKGTAFYVTLPLGTSTLPPQNS